MPEAKEAPKVHKTYVSRSPSQTCSYAHANGKRETIKFIGGKFSTNDADKQAHIEALDIFGKTIHLAPSERDGLALKAKDLRAEAVKADKAAKEAEEALKAFDAPDAPKAAAKPVAPPKAPAAPKAPAQAPVPPAAAATK